MKANTAKKSKDVENIYAGNKMWVKKAYTDEIAALWLETINPTKPKANTPKNIAAKVIPNTNLSCFVILCSSLII